MGENNKKWITFIHYSKTRGLVKPSSCISPVGLQWFTPITLFRKFQHFFLQILDMQ